MDKGGIRVMTQEQLEKVLRSNKNIEVEGWIEPDEYGFSRKIAFTIRGGTLCNSVVL